MEWIDLPDSRIRVSGLAWFREESPSYRRLPSRLKDSFREPVWELAQCPAGGRLRFRTDSTHVGIRASYGAVDHFPHMPLTGKSGFDIYVDNKFMCGSAPENGKLEADWVIAKKPAMREITINMPLYEAVSIDQIGLDKGATIADPTPFALEKPVVFYGSSITQGGCASTPGTSYQSFISRTLNVDFINLGFSGNGLGEPELAAAICEIDSACIVLDHWGNRREGFGENVLSFVRAIRAKYPNVPIIVVGPFYWCEESVGDRTHYEQRRGARAAVKHLKEAGDTNIYYYDGRRMISKEEGHMLVDGVHCTSEGFSTIARKFTPYLKRVLGL